MENKLPFYMAYPVPLLYNDDRNARRDYDYMKSIYPDTAKRVLPYMEEECDRMEYDGSMMYDEYPDRLQLRLMVGNEFKGNVRMGKGQPLHEGTDVSRLRHGGLQKFPSGRYIIKQIPYKECRPLRCSDLTEFTLGATLNLIVYAGKILLCLRNQLHLGYSTDTG